LFKLTRQDSEYQSGPLTDAALKAFKMLQTQLSKQPALAFPRHDWNYLLITNAYLPNQDSPGGLCANLAQQNHQGKIQIISHALRQLKENEKNYTKFLLETAAAAWGMDNFNEYLNGSKFTLYKDTTTEAVLGTTQLKTLNRLQTTMNEHDFEIQDRQKSDLPDFLKKKQKLEEPRRLDQDQAFNKTIHVDLINTQTNPDKVSGKTIISITDDSKTFSTSAVLSNSRIDSMVSAIWNQWCQPYGLPETILFKQGKVQTSKLESRINELVPLEQKISCRSRKDTFNPEIEQQWQQYQNEISEEEFIHTLNFFCNLQNPARTKSSDNDQVHFDRKYEDLTGVEDFAGCDEDPDDEYEEFPLIDDQLLHQINKRKQVSLCWHKLQGRANGQSRRWRQAINPQPRLSNFEEITDHEWAQLRQMEEIIERHKQKLLKVGIHESEDEEEDWGEHQEPEDDPVKEEDDSLDDGDLNYITDMESFAKPKIKPEPTSTFNYAMLTPEGAPTQAPTNQMTPPKFNQKFNQNFNNSSTSERSEAKNFSCFPTIWEEGPTELADYFT
jgi:hypothetical protein